MKTDAASTGFYTSATGKKYPRVQLLTIEGLMNGTQQADHPDYAPANFKQARKEGERAAGGVAVRRRASPLLRGALLLDEAAYFLRKAIAGTRRTSPRRQR